MKWYRNKQMLNETFEQNINYLQKTKNEKTQCLLADYNNLILDHLELLDENEKLKKTIEYEIELLIERRFNAYACDDYETHNVLNTIIEELKEVLGNE